jgi:microsomal dipeptidase-like Zn-dependent dipeptidase
MMDRGMLIDVAHMSEKGVGDVRDLAKSTAPITRSTSRTATSARS